MQQFGELGIRNLPMHFCVFSLGARASVFALKLMLTVVFAFSPRVGDAEILWSGDFGSGTFENWAETPDQITIWGTPAYGRPVQYGGQNSLHVGNGELMWLTADTDSGNFRAGPRLGPHAVGLHVKSLNGGSVEAVSTGSDVVGDCDGDCVRDRRRTELRGMGLHYEKKLIPYMTTRWASASIFIPGDWDSENGSGWGPVTWQWKPQRNNSTMSPPIALEIKNGYWEINLRTNPNENPAGDGWTRHRFNPAVTDSIHYPDALVSRNALSNLNKGEWTHFVIQLRLDGRRSTEGGTGFINLWMRHGDGAWVPVLNFFPTPDYGVLFKQSGDDAFFGFHASLYLRNSQVLDLPGPGRTLYYDNLKVGGEKSTLAEMAHDGVFDEVDLAPPRAPAVEIQ